MSRKYFNISAILPYQRNFNFINGPRSIGKTYGTLKFLIKRALDKNEEFVYLVRTQDEKKSGVIERATEKVRENEFPQYEFSCDTENLYCGAGRNEEHKVVLGRCIALSEAAKIKKQSFPNVRWLIFDEYMLEAGSMRYVNGWKEPDLLLNIYHTIDREKDKVTCFMLGNNTSFYNPYHLHPAFAIPETAPGGIWCSENVLFQWATVSEELEEEKSNCRFLKMLGDTSYGKYARDGMYTEDKTTLIEKRPKTAKHRFNIISDGEPFGVWFDADTNIYYIDSKCNINAGNTYSAGLEDHHPGMILLGRSGNMEIIVFAEAFKAGRGRFVSMPIQAKCLKWIHKIV